MTRLADISLLNPVRISVLDEHRGQSEPQGGAVLEASPLPAGSEPDSFAIPESLHQHVALVPSKLRLVSLAAFILQKCKVGPHPRPRTRGPAQSREEGPVFLCQVLMAANRGTLMDTHAQEFSSSPVFADTDLTSQQFRGCGKEPEVRASCHARHEICPNPIPGRRTGASQAAETC